MVKGRANEPLDLFVPQMLDSVAVQRTHLDSGLHSGGGAGTSLNPSEHGNLGI